jgi:DNA polymerase III subunit chi
VERADFYVLEGSDSRQRWRFACQQIEKAFLAEERVLVWLDNDADVAAFDDLLWTFADRSFIPHEALSADSDWDETPVLLSAGREPPTAPQVIVNLATASPPGLERVIRIVEVVDADAARRQSGRLRFKHYRTLGVEPVTHKPGAADA